MTSNLQNSGKLWRALQGLKNTCNDPTRNFLSRKFLRRAIKLGKKAGFWERAAFDFDADVADKIRNGDQ